MKKNIFSLCSILMSFTLSACSNFQRSSDSGYSQRKASQRDSSHKVSSSVKSSRNEDPSHWAEKVRLQNLENSLNTKKEIEQYSKSLPWFKNESERIEFLSQGSFDDKQAWLNEKNFPNRPSVVTSEMQELVEAQDITVGMPQSLVKKSWGEPDVVEVAGNPAYRNERWRYNKYISTQEGYKPEKKVVYFEGGKVVGWEVE